MKLEGTLDAFSLPDIFQLLSFTKKSGGLHLRRSGVHGCVYFADGAISGALSDDARQSLARRLVAAAQIPLAALQDAVARAEADGIGVGRALLEAGAVDETTLRAVVTDQAVDAVFDFLRWPDGEFSLAVDEICPDDVGVRLATDEIVAEARSRFDVWERACRVIPSPETVLAIPVCVGEEPRLSRAEWALLALVDGRRTVAEVVALAGRGDFAVVSALAGLVERHLLVVRGGADDSGVEGLLRRHELLARLERGVSPVSTGRPSPESAEEKAPRGEPAPAAPAPSQPQAPAAEGAGAVSFEDDADLPTSSTVGSVLAAAARADTSPRLIPDSRGPVVPPRPEPFLPPRRPEFPEEGPTPRVVGTAAALAQPVEAPRPKIERDPSVNKSLLLRLIAGVRGL